MISSNARLRPPHKRSALIERPELLARIDRGLESRLLLVCAPAGYGKTTALIQAHDTLRSRGVRVSWISLDEEDRDLGRFASLLLAATGSRDARASSSPLFGLGTAMQGSAETLRMAVLNELAMLPDEICLILDDYHLVTDDDIRNLVNAIILSSLPQLRVLIGSRTHNALPVGRLRALGQIEEIEVTDLTFSEREVGEFVARVRGAPISAAQSARLRDITESWAASLQMAGIALRDVEDVDAFLDRFSGEHRSVSDFLGEEVLRRQPPALQEFVTVTSILRRFNWQLCDAVTGGNDGRAMIEEVERRNLFLFSIDPERRWFRYHPLFAGFLRRRLADRYPERLIEAHARASTWLAAQRFSTEAIEHAFAAGAMDRAGELLDRASSDLFAAGQTSTLLSLSARLPGKILERLPRLQLERAWHSELSWDFAAARAALDRVRAVLDEWRARPDADQEDLAFLESKFAHRQMMLRILSDDAPGTIASATQWLADDVTRDPFMNASAGTALIAAHRVMFRCEGIHTSARMLLARYVEAGALYGIVFHQCIVGAALFETGELEAAREAFEHALEVAVELQGEHSALYNMPALMLAELLYEQDEVERAAELLAERDIASALGFVDNLIAGFATRARLHAVRGRTPEADRLLAEGTWLARRLGFSRMEAALAHARLHILVSAGQGTAAAAVFEAEAGATDGPATVEPGPESGMTDFWRAQLVARERLQAGGFREAAELMKRWFQFARRRGCLRSALRAGVLLSRALSAGGDRRGALRSLCECLLLAGSRRFVRTFVDEGAEVGDLVAEISALRDHPGGPQLQEMARALQRAFDVGDEVEFLPGAQPIAALRADLALSAREIEILELGARGLQNLDIARSLFLAQSTVKWYWQRIYEKLGVRRRPDAIRLAREHQWIR